jgi:hypothetical protein
MHRVFPVCSRLPVVPQRTSRRDLLSSPIGASPLGDFGFGRIARLASWRRSARRLPHARKLPASCRRTCHGFLPCWELLYGAPRVQRPTLAQQPRITSKLQSHISYGPATSRCSDRKVYAVLLGNSPRGDAPIGEANVHAKDVKCRKSAVCATKERGDGRALSTGPRQGGRVSRQGLDEREQSKASERGQRSS